MTNQELKEYNASRKLVQICMITEDLYKTMENWVKILKVGPWKVMEFNNNTVDELFRDGKQIEEPFRYLIGVCFIGDMQIELIQPIEGPLIHMEFLKAKGAGIHHIKEKVPEDQFDAILDEYAMMGFKTTQGGWYGADRHAYVDTEPALDFVLELGNCPYKHNPIGYIGMYPPEE